MIVDVLLTNAGQIHDPRWFTPGLAKGDPYKLYLITNPAVRKELDLKPFGIKIEALDFCADRFTFRDDRYEIPALLAFVRLAHSLSSDDGKRVMPRWMIVDLALMPSAILLALAGPEQVTKVARDLERTGASAERAKAAILRDLLQAAHERGYDGPLPVAGYAAIPTPDRGCWVGGSLWWSLVPHAKLGYSVRRIALRCYGAQREIGVTQVGNARALQAQKNFGRLRVTHANLAVHPSPDTFIFEVDVAALEDNGKPSETVDPPAETIPPDAVQAAIEAGSHCYITPGQEAGMPPLIYTQTPERRESPRPRRRRRPRWTRRQPSHPPGRAAGRDFFAKDIGTGPYQPYVICNSDMLDRLNLAPCGVPVRPIDFCKETFGEDIPKYKVPDLVELLNRAIALSYAESGLGMPKWAMVELALMPSAVLLIMADQAHLSVVADSLASEPVLDTRRTRLIPLTEDDRNRLRNAHSLRSLLKSAQERGYEGPLPIAGFAAAPTPDQDRWVGWSLWSLVPGERLGYTAKRLGLACYGVKKQSAVMQFGMARGIDVVAKFGRLRLTTVDVRPHPAPHAFAYEIDVSQLPADGSAVTDGRRRKPQWQLDPDSDQLASDLDRMRRGIERGTRYYLVARSIGNSCSPVIPVWQSRAPHRWMRARAKLFVSHVRSRRDARRRARYPGRREG